MFFKCNDGFRCKKIIFNSSNIPVLTIISITVEFNCPVGLHFDPQLSACNRPAAANCLVRRFGADEDVPQPLEVVEEKVVEEKAE